MPTDELPGTNPLADLRLLQLLSPTIPTGAFNFSQGLEWAVAEHWVTSVEDFHGWLQEQLAGVITCQDLPLLRQMYLCCGRNDLDGLRHWADLSLAFRDTAELQREEIDRAGALVRVLRSLEVGDLHQAGDALTRSQLAGVAWAGAFWSIPHDKLLSGYVYSWLEQQVAAGIKLVPLGQLQGQRLLFKLARLIPDAVQHATELSLDDIGFSSPALSIASSLHETQYTRLYRS